MRIVLVKVEVRIAQNSVLYEPQLRRNKLNQRNED